MLQLLRTTNEDDKDDITFKYSSFFHLGRKKIFFGCQYRRLQGNEKEHFHFCKQKEMKAVTIVTNSSICTTLKSTIKQQTAKLSQLTESSMQLWQSLSKNSCLALSTTK